MSVGQRGFKDDSRTVSNPEDIHRVLEQCRGLQLITDRQYDHIVAAMKDSNAKVTYARSDGGRKITWLIAYEVEQIA